MEQITDEIKQLGNQINAVEQQLKKPFKVWTEEEKKSLETMNSSEKKGSSLENF